jgi:hypothetical protein
VTKSVRSKIKSLKESCGQYLEGKDDRISEDKVQEYGTVGFCSFFEDKKEDQFSSKTTKLFNGKKTENMKKV